MFFMYFSCGVFLLNIKEGIKKPHKLAMFVSCVLSCLDEGRVKVGQSLINH